MARARRRPPEDPADASRVASPPLGVVKGREDVIRICLDYRPARFGRTGIAVYTRELAAALAARFPEDDWRLYADRARPVEVQAEPEIPPGATLHAGRIPSRLLALGARVGLGLERRVGGADVVHWTDYVMPPPLRAPLVATIHDVLFETLPACATPEMRHGCRRATRRLVDQAARIVVPARRSRDDLVRLFGADPDRIDVIPHGFRRLPSVEPERRERPYVLFAATLEPRKNAVRLLEAWRRLDPEAELVLVGPRGWKDAPILRAIERAPGAEWLGPVEAVRLAALYRGARLLAYPSLGEGFGLPVLEAMSVGCPVLVGRDTTCEDVAGEGGLSVDPEDVDAIAEGLARLLGDEALCARLGAAGRVRATPFTWTRAAEATRAVYAKAALS